VPRLREYTVKNCLLQNMQQNSIYRSNTPKACAPVYRNVLNASRNAKTKWTPNHIADVDFLLCMSSGASMRISDEDSTTFTPAANHLCIARYPRSMPITTSQSTNPMAIVVAAAIPFKNLPSCLSLANGVTTNTTQKNIPGVCFQRDSGTRQMFIHSCRRSRVLQACDNGVLDDIAELYTRLTARTL
jgi:hypothetical protein